MRFQDNLDKTKGGYVFLSHSHADIDKVRKIRNALENEGFEPLCFYLKCLSEDNEIEELIKREIDAREWFVFVNSENSRNSKWVTLEREYINKTNAKKILTVDIDDEEDVSGLIDKILHSLRVFISYALSDREIAARIIDKLREKDYRVFDATTDLGVCLSYTDSFCSIIESVAKEGIVLYLVSSTSLQSQWVFHEVEYALKCEGKVIPVVLGDTLLTEKFNLLFGDVLYYRLPAQPTDADLDALIESIGKSIVENK